MPAEYPPPAFLAYHISRGIAIPISIFVLFDTILCDGNSRGGRNSYAEHFDVLIVIVDTRAVIYYAQDRKSVV